MNIPSNPDLDNVTVAKAYARWAPVYDLVFGAVFERCLHAAVTAAEQIGVRVLEVGVGTGVSLPLYSSNCRLCGVNISAPCCARRRSGSLSSTSPMSRGYG